MFDGYIFVVDMDTKKSMLRHQYLFVGLGMFDQEDVFVTAIAGVGDELLAIVTSSNQVWILQSEGFGGKNMDVIWHQSQVVLPTMAGPLINSPLSFDYSDGAISMG